MPMKSILAVGAYDRDNFGDILFYLLTKQYLKDHFLIPGGVTTADMRQLMGEIVLPYPLLLQTRRWDIVWVAGGEVGGVTKTDALRMVIPQEFDQTYLDLDKDIRDSINNVISYSFEGSNVAYIPNITDAEQKGKPKHILNSVGLASLDNVPQESREATNLILAEADHVSVRDIASKEYCDKHGISARLAPDLVHVSKKQFGSLARPKELPEAYVVVQFNKLSQANKNLELIARELDTLAENTGLHIVMFAAGTASHHDNFEDYENLQRLMRTKDKVLIFYERDPMSLVSCIAHSRLWIGSSLHGRIIAVSYSVPRVSLVNEKVSVYAEHWDSKLPYNVSLDDIAGAAEEALNINVQQLDEVAQKLETEAHDNMVELMKAVKV